MKKQIGLLALFVVFATLLATNGLATLSVTEGNGTTALEPWSRLDSNLTINSDELTNISGCNATLTATGSTNPHHNTTAITIMLDISEHVDDTDANLNATYFNVTDQLGQYAFSTLVDGVYRLTSVVCINLTGDSTDNETAIAQDLYIDNLDPSMPLFNTTDGQIFEDKNTVSVNASVDDTKNTSACIINFDGTQRFPGNHKYYEVNATSDGVCQFTWPWASLPDGHYRYTISGYDGLNESANTSIGTQVEWRTFVVEEGKAGMSNLIKMQQLKEAGYASVETSTGTLDLTQFSLFDGDGITSGSNMLLLIGAGVLIYVLVAKKKK